MGKAGFIYPCLMDLPDNDPCWSFDYVCNSGSLDNANGCMTKWHAVAIFESEFVWEYGVEEGSHYIVCPNCDKAYFECEHFG